MDNIKLFSYSIAGGNTCWLQTALVVIQGEQKYRSAIQYYNNIYGHNINSQNNDEKFEAKLMQSIHNFLNDKTEHNIAEISKSYQEYVKYKHSDASAQTQKDIDHSFGGTYDATTFLGHIEEILKGQVGQNFQENRLVLNNGEIVESPNNLGNCEYIFSYTPGHWVAYRKEGDKYVEYNTSSPNQRNKYTLKQIMSKNQQTSNYQVSYAPSKTSWNNFSNNKSYNYTQNDIKYFQKTPTKSSQQLPNLQQSQQLPDIPPLKYHPYYYPRQNINYYQPYYNPYRTLQRFQPQYTTPYRNFYQYQYRRLYNPYYNPYRATYGNQFGYYPNYTNYNWRLKRFQPQYTTPYRNFYQYQYRMPYNFPSYSRYNGFFNLNTTPYISQSQFSYH